MYLNRLNVQVSYLTMTMEYILIELWHSEIGIQRFPRDGEWGTYKYKIGQLDMFDDWDELDGVIEQLDSA